MSIIIPERRIRDIITSGLRSRQFSNEECFHYALQLIDFAIKAGKMTNFDRGSNV
jgi:hypothetical protein